MSEIRVEGAKLIGETWHYHKRIPKRLREAFGLPEFKRGTMRTKDPDEARRLARAMLAELDQLARQLDSVSARVGVFSDLSNKEQAALLDEVEANVKALPIEQRQAIRKAGGVFEAGRKMREHEVQAAFLRAGQGAEFDVLDDVAEEYDPEDREDEEAADKAKIGVSERRAGTLRAALTGAKVIEPRETVDGIRSVMERFCDAKGYVNTSTHKNKTRGQYEYAVRRFTEWAGEVPLQSLGRRHIADFATDFLRLPVSSRKVVRPLLVREAVKVADAEGLPRASERTRDQNLILLKALMAHAVKEGWRDAPDPWEGYTPTVAKTKFSERGKMKPKVFSRDEMRAIINHVSNERNRETIDYWGALIGAHHGLRVEEYCQFRVADFATIDGMFCVNVTDEDDYQKLKTENNYRTIPVHPKLVELGFEGYVERRRKAGGNFLFLKAKRWGGELVELEPAGFGRLADAYGKRLRGTDLPKLGITGYRAGSHSFRHGWTDIARNAGIPYEHRLALAGRDSETGERIPDRSEKTYGHGFELSELARSLKRINVLD